MKNTIKVDEKKLRKENVVWTISEDYDYVPVINLFDKYEDYDMDFYKMMVLGYVYKKIDFDELLNFISIHLAKTTLQNEFLKFIELFLEDCFGNDLVAERPGAYDYREKFYESILNKHKDAKKFTVEEELEFVYYSRIKGKYVTCRPVVEELVTYIRKFNNRKNTNEIITALNAVFLKYFYANYRTNPDPNSTDNLLQGNKEKKQEVSKEKPRLNFTMRKKNIKNLKDGDMVGEVTIESAEFTKNISEDEKINDERLKENKSSVSSSSDSKVKQMVEARYGEAIYPEYYTNNLENDLCTGIHRGIKIHITEGKFVDGKYDKFYKNAILSQRERNIEYYKDRELTFRRSINELREILRKKFMPNDEEEIEFAKQGKLVPSRIWRSKYLNDDKVFIKSNRDDVGTVSVDILLDASSSQMEREEYVSSQAFIICEALTSLNIPTRVMGFCNFFNYLVLTQYRDYKDPKTANSNVFNYKISGSNRDGLALKFLSSQMDTREEEHKILIVLSDGKPNDKINIGKSGFIKVDGQDYEDEVAVKDTAQEVFNIKLREKHILGVYTGEDEDLEYEKRIYGKDFAYIRDMERFSHIIGFYLEQLIL